MTGSGGIGQGQTVLAITMKALLSTLLVLLLIAVSTGGVRAAEIAVLMSSDAAIYQDALEGFREVVRNRTINVQTLADRRDEWPDQLKKLRVVVEPDLIFVIGTPALQAVSVQISRIPIVHAMVFNPFGDHISSGRNITGISMIPSADKVMSLIKELNPKIRRVGVMYDPARSGLLYSKAQSVAQKERIQLIDRKIRSPGEIAAALKSFESEIDLLWLWPDERFLTDEILQRLLLFSFEKQIPVLGLSARHTQMGALVSLSYGSAKDMGRQAGGLANNILRDNRSPLVPLIAPRRVSLTVNLKTARKLDVEVPDTIVKRADNAIKRPIYRNGDWWLFQTKRILNGVTKTEVHRVTFVKDKFESDDPNFLTGGDVAGTPFFLPFASVYLTDPARKWLDFPLLPGKTWSFRYLRRRFTHRSSPLTMWARPDAEVIGKTSRPVETPAGTFDAIEIRRTELAGGPAELTYFYSPRTQSVVKLRAEILGGEWAQQFRLELIAYGRGGKMGKASP